MSVNTKSKCKMSTIVCTSVENGHTVNDRFANLLVITRNIRILVSSHIRHARRLTVNFRQRSHPHKIGSAPEG
jgi:hypothetical protein